MTIAGSYELENTVGSQNEALPSHYGHKHAQTGSWLKDLKTNTKNSSTFTVKYV